MTAFPPSLLATVPSIDALPIVRAIVVLTALAVALLIAVRLVPALVERRRSGLGADPGTAPGIESVLRLGPGVQVHVLRVDGRRLLVGSARDERGGGLSVLAELAPVGATSATAPVVEAVGSRFTQDLRAAARAAARRAAAAPASPSAVTEIAQ